ncbi:MAG: hypothetical protein J6J16_02265 [Lachnospiraceae bacterium]|nr:hypothetical protein [Lachnospiraceae bacterium]
MDNYNGQNNQYQQNYNGYVNNEQYQYQQNYVQYNQQMYNVAPQPQVYETDVKRKFFSVSMILCLLSTLLILIGFLMPAIDFSHFHEEIDIQYNLSKLCKNIRLISPLWTALPVGFIIGIVFMGILAFVRIPQFRLIPCILIIAMFVIMLVDMNNVIVWADDLLNSESIQELVKQEFVINKTEVFKSLQPGIYVMVAGTILGIISSFIKPSEA